MSSPTLVLAALFLLAAPPVEKKPRVPDPECPGGTEMKTEGMGTDLTKFCVKRNGEREGPFIKIYTPTNTLQERGSYHAGQMHGPWSKWDSNGTLREQGTWHEGNQRSYWTTFHENGKKASTGEFGNDGYRRGVWTTWDDKGQMLETGEYRASQKHGFWTTYDPVTGKVLKQVEYSNGVERAPR